MLNHIDGLLSDWVEFQIRMLEGSGIGYSSTAPIYTLMRFGTKPDHRPAGSVVPFLSRTPDAAKRIDRVLRVLPDDLLEILRSHYVTRERGQRRSAAYYRRLDKLHYTVQGAPFMLDA